MKIRIYIFFMLIFGQSFSLYSCEEPKSGDELEIVDLTSSKYDVASYQVVLAFRGIVSSDARAHKETGYFESYPNIEYFRGSMVCDKPVNGDRRVEKDSLKFKDCERAVEEFTAACRHTGVKNVFYRRAIDCVGMSLGDIDTYCNIHYCYHRAADPVNCGSVYCFTHHCYYHECLPLYAYQAYLLQPSYICDSYVKKDETYETVKKEGRLAVLRKMDPVSSKKQPMNIIRKVQSRQVGMMLEMRQPAKQELK